MPRIILITLLALLSFGAARGDGRTMRFVFTSDLDPVFAPGSTEVGDKPQGALKSLLDRLREEDPESVFVDLGNSVSPHSFMETSYGYVSLNALRDYGFDAVHLTARDAVISGTNNFGIAAMGERDLAQYFGSFGVDNPDSGVAWAPEPVKKVARGGASATLVSLGNPAGFAAWRGAREALIQRDRTEDFVAMESSPAALVVAVTDRPPAEVDRIAESAPDGSIIVSIRGPRNGRVAPARDGGATVVQGPPPGSALVVDVAEDGKVTARHEAFSIPEAYFAIRKAPLPEIGVGITNAEAALAERFGADPASVGFEKHGGQDFGDLLDRERIFVFRGMVDGVEHRFYRVQNRVQFLRTDGVLTPVGYPMVDIVAMVGPDHRLKKVAVRDSFRFMGYVIDVAPLWESLYGADPEAWIPDYDPFPGAEEFAAMIARDLRYTLELDRRLFGAARPAGE
ncbi:MAG: hypothetical protein SF028_01260 [Candidatus Sumerlaeia bacterium]|nr:hypothetical protein [Candidatus Sumerlaeia bacterium]